MRYIMKIRRRKILENLKRDSVFTCTKSFGRFRFLSAARLYSHVKFKRIMKLLRRWQEVGSRIVIFKGRVGDRRLRIYCDPCTRSLLTAYGELLVSKKTTAGIRKGCFLISFIISVKCFTRTDASGFELNYRRKTTNGCLQRILERLAEVSMRTSGARVAFARLNHPWRRCYILPNLKAQAYYNVVH